MRRNPISWNNSIKGKSREGFGEGQMETTGYQYFHYWSADESKHIHPAKKSQ